MVSFVAIIVKIIRFHFSKGKSSPHIVNFLISIPPLAFLSFLLVSSISDNLNLSLIPKIFSDFTFPLMLGVLYFILFFSFHELFDFLYLRIQNPFKLILIILTLFIIVALFPKPIVEGVGKGMTSYKGPTIYFEYLYCKCAGISIDGNRLCIGFTYACAEKKRD